MAFSSWSLDAAGHGGRAALRNCRAPAPPGPAGAVPARGRGAFRDALPRAALLGPRGTPGRRRAPSWRGTGWPQLQPHSSMIMSSWWRTTISPFS